MKFRATKTSPALKELNELLSLAFARWVSHTGPSLLWQNCITCIHMRQKGSAFCNRYNLVPPVRVIVGEDDCEGWQSKNDIPF